MKQIIDVVSTWPNISVHPHRFGGQEFLFGKAEIGHIHPTGEVDIPFPHSFHDELLKQGLAEQHHFVPASGWITFRVQKEDDIKQVLWLLRLSYLRYLLKTVSNPHELLETESQVLNLSPSFKSLFENLITHANNRSSD